MKKETKKTFYIGLCMLAVFVLWTIIICFVDVKAVGPNGSAVGLAAINQFVHKLTGVHMVLYNLTDWLGLVPLVTVLCFALTGLVQWVKRKRLIQVDRAIFLLGGFYLVVMTIYVFFEIFIVNYRPVLINEMLEASYPSSTTMLVLCVMPTAAIELNDRIKQRWLRQCSIAVIILFTAFMVISRLISGVHWFTDILGGILLSAGLVLIYHSTRFR